MTSTRLAVLDDLDQLLELGRLMFMESQYAKMEFDAEFCRLFIKQFICNDDSCIVVAEREGVILGGVLGTLTPFYFSPLLQAEISCFFVHPDRRGGIATLKLLHGFKTWAKNRGAVGVYTQVVSGHPTAGRFYAKMGFEPFGIVYSLTFGGAEHG